MGHGTFPSYDEWQQPQEEDEYNDSSREEDEEEQDDDNDAKEDEQEEQEEVARRRTSGARSVLQRDATGCNRLQRAVTDGALWVRGASRWRTAAQPKAREE